ncbi:hypothetical protein EYF80_030976 [Liparis tanakae]|uniref:Uncharacterized protein n=1 Tax=Liparis tanakae TaxID=230148 RepID=A0A4Z2GYV4_9TELE|nr:hypothetical protein EYF80_030976 [Liparis tanakae]
MKRSDASGVVTSARRPMRSLRTRITVSSFTPSAANLRMPSDSFSTAMRSSLCRQRHSPASSLSVGVMTAWSPLSSASSPGEMVSRSQPASAFTCPVFRKEAPITTVP